MPSEAYIFSRRRFDVVGDISNGGYLTTSISYYEGWWSPEEITSYIAALGSVPGNYVLGCNQTQIEVGNAPRCYFPNEQELELQELFLELGFENGPSESGGELEFGQDAVSIIVVTALSVLYALGFIAGHQR